MTPKAAKSIRSVRKKSAASRTPKERQALRKAITALNERSSALGLFDPLDVGPSWVCDPKDQQ